MRPRASSGARCSSAGSRRGSCPTPDAASTNVSFTAGSDTLGVALTTTGMTSNFGMTWKVVGGELEGFQTQNNVSVEVVKFDLTGTTSIAPNTTGTVTVTETLLAAINGEGSTTGNLGTVNVVGTDINHSPVTDLVTATVVDDAPKANPDTGSTTEGATLTVAASSGLFSAANTGGADLTGADLSGAALDPSASCMAPAPLITTVLCIGPVFSGSHHSGVAQSAKSPCNFGMRIRRVGRVRAFQENACPCGGGGGIRFSVRKCDNAKC